MWLLNLLPTIFLFLVGREIRIKSLKKLSHCLLVKYPRWAYKLETLKNVNVLDFEWENSFKIFSKKKTSTRAVESDKNKRL